MAASRSTLPMVVLTTLFFMWGFMTVMNDVLIPHLKAVFTLSYAQSMLVQFAFFGAYFVGSVASLRPEPARQRPHPAAGLQAGLHRRAAAERPGGGALRARHLRACTGPTWRRSSCWGWASPCCRSRPTVRGHHRGTGRRQRLVEPGAGLQQPGHHPGAHRGRGLIFRLFAGDAAVRWPYLAFAGLLVLQAGWLADPPAGAAALKGRHGPRLGTPAAGARHGGHLLLRGRGGGHRQPP